MAITESGITLDFPDNNFFRFQDCTAYSTLQNLKEMDACWYDQASDVLFLIELKDWKNARISEELDPKYTLDEIQEKKKGISNHRKHELVKKSVDSVSMCLSMILQHPQGKAIQNCAPFSITRSTQIKLLSIINWTDSDVTYLSNMNDEYRALVQPYAKLFNIKTYMVMTKAQASQAFEWIK
jgi:hypothetical protein